MSRISTIMEVIPEIDEKTKDIEISPEELAKMIDHTKLSPYKAEGSLKRLCDEAKSYRFYSVCVNPYYTKFCAEQLESEDIAICTVVGFPLGQNTSETKSFEAEKAIEDGADEIDMVMNIAAFKDEKYDVVKDDIGAVVDAAGENLVKVIIETGYLTYEEVTKASELVKEAGADFVKSSTGFGPYGANIPHIHLMREAVGEDFGVKAAGGIYDFRDTLRMIAAGATRIGTSAGVKIIDSYEWAKHTDWFVEEIPCRLCPSRKSSFGNTSKSVFQYYKEKCVDCPYKEYNRYYE